MVGAALSEKILERAQNLPLKPDPIILEGKFVRLMPLELERDVAELYAKSNGKPLSIDARRCDAYDAEAMIWRYMTSGPFANVEELAKFLQPQIIAANGLCFCVFDKNSNTHIGVSNYMNNIPAHLKMELGNIWYSPIAQGTKANLEATYLLLKHAFSLGYRRLEWKCDSGNERSCKAALRMGFKFEGIQEQHFIVKGRNRDTAWYRILDCEWLAVETSLEALLEY